MTLDCNDILIQSAAVNAAVNAFNKELLRQSYPNLCGKKISVDGKDENH